jgi:hypothetical protein
MKIHRLTEQEKEYAINAYQVELKPMITIAKECHVDRQAIYKFFKRAGIDTSKAVAAHITSSCCVCGKPVTKTRCIIRKTKHTFCDTQCYFAWLKHGNGNPLIVHRHSARLSRTEVSKYFNLLPDQVVHHEDRDQRNTHISNLIVFANQGDHVRYHRGIDVPIIWKLDS